MQTLAIDFDGVIHQYRKGFFDGTIYDTPEPGAREVLEGFVGRYRLVIFTCREDLGEVARWMYENGIPFDEVTHEKPIARVYIDDNALQFENWGQTQCELVARGIL